MASAAISGNLSSDSFQPFEYDTTFKVSADSSALKTVPKKFNYTNEPAALPSDSFPTVDFSALTAADPDQRSKAVHDLAAACREWGFFNLVNHGIDESLTDAVLAAVTEFFNLPDSEKKQYEAKNVSDPIKYGNFNLTTTSNQTFTLWKDYLTLSAHPEFHCPHQPQLLREVVLEYSEKNRTIARKLIESVCDALELDPHYVDEAFKLDSINQVFAANYYPPCPQPAQAIGIPPHTDPALFTLLVHNGVPGLHVEHGGQWFKADSPKNSIFVNVSDQLEIFTNGRYKSVNHRAVVNKEKERISIVMVHGPSRDAIVGPAAALVEKDGRAVYSSMNYGDYVDWKVFNSRVGGKSTLEERMIVQDN